MKKKKNRSRMDHRPIKNTNNNIPNRPNNTNKNTNTSDRLSALPDDVICHIISFLPSTKTSVRTSILAKAWRRIWTRVPFLEFGSSDPVDPRIINRVMLQHKGQAIHTFHFHYSENDNSCTGFDLETWILNLLESNVRNLVIQPYYELNLPSCLSSSQTLVELTLSHCKDIPTGPTISFPALKKLHLDCIEYESEDSIPRMLSGCPALDELAIKMSHYQRNIKICLPKLTRLSIRSTDPYNREWAYELKLDTPLLGYLDLRYGHFEILSAGALTLLNEARVDCGDHNCVVRDVDTDDDIEWKLVSSRRVLEFVRKMCNVKCLKLTTPLIVPYPMFSAPAPKFRNLTELKLCDCFCFLKIFLENADCLRLLTMVIHDTRSWKGSPNWEEPKQVPACLMSSLETVKLVNFEFDMESQFDVVRYILKNGKVLKRMTVSTQVSGVYYGYGHLSNDSTRKFEALKRLALFERVSNACQLQIVSS